MLIISLVLVSGCTGQVRDDAESVKKSAIDACVNICKYFKDKDISNGPCIGDPMSENPDWVCDVAHSPRQDVDNLPENQCLTYRENKASHFVEVDTNCNLIRAI
jgi:hypothetical protein